MKQSACIAPGFISSSGFKAESLPRFARKDMIINNIMMMARRLMMRGLDQGVIDGLFDVK